VLSEILDDDSGGKGKNIVNIIGRISINIFLFFDMVQVVEMYKKENKFFMESI
jgi:hypothetical protein